MKRTMRPALGLTAVITALLIIFQVSCSTGTTEEKKETAPEKKELTYEELRSRGQYVAAVSGCHDCHTPKKFGPQGPVFDSTRMLAGHPAADPLPPIDIKALQPGHWVLFAPDLTSAVGPWGISYSANLTPDSATGIGAWDEATFVKALRTGKHMGMDNGRPILPPMPWQTIGTMTDEDLKALYTFMRSLPPVSNRVPGPVPPNEVAPMAK